MDSREKVLPQSVIRILSNKLINIAPLETAFQSSTYGNYVASYKINEDTISKYVQMNDDNRWWIVELNKEYNIKKIIV